VTEGAELILGGVRSGKSAYAERQAQASGRAVHLIATATAGDAEMAARIAAHQERRPAQWTTHEVSLQLADALSTWATPARCLLVDCLGLWLSNLLHAGEAIFTTERQALLDILPTLPGRVLLVSNEVGWGLVPTNALARRFADELGWLNQAVAACCRRVVLLAAGLPLTLKETP
jgi:adenosylcobinamide kinase/adenosylcobinamide-phosphate guanylyltransferase